MSDRAHAGAQKEAESQENKFLISSCESLPQNHTPSLEYTERSWWENPWFCLLIALYSSLPDSNSTLGENVLPLPAACHVSFLPFSLLTLGHWNKGMAKGLPFPGLLQEVRLTAPDLPCRVQKANRWLRDWVTTRHRQLLKYGWHRVFG